MCAQAHVSFVYEVFIFEVFMGSILISNIDFDLHILFFFLVRCQGLPVYFYIILIRSVLLSLSDDEYRTLSEHRNGSSHTKAQ